MDVSCDKYALECDTRADEVSKKTSDTIADITSNGVNEKNLMHVKNVLGMGVAKVISATYPLAEKEMEDGLREYSPRSFIMSPSFRINLAEFYSRYIPVLAANMAARNFLNIQNIIRKGEADGLSEKEITDNIARTYIGLHSNGRIIVRTEGTRAVSLARRAVAQRQAAQGNGPDFYIYRSLRDSRTTEVCKYLHNVYWDSDKDDFSMWPPSHYFCRAGVIFGWNGMLLSSDAPRKLRGPMLGNARAMQKEQFPDWKQMEGDALINPAASAADTFLGRGYIRDDVDLTRVLKESNIAPPRTRKDNAIASKIRDMARSIKKGDKILMEDIMDELDKIE